MNNIYQYNLGQLFEKISIENSDKIAINYSEEGQNKMYKEVNILSNKIAHFLISQDIKKNDVVAILNNKTFTSYSIMIACLKIGVIYTNLDPKSPIERFNKMLKICNPKILFYYQDEYSIINDFQSNTLKTIDYTLDKFSNELSLNESLPTSNFDVNSNDPAYIMFTSGSTGFPKGVVISHQNILNFIEWSKTTYHTTSNDVFTNINPMHFDNSVFDFYSSLFTGASIIPINENLTRNPRKLLDTLNYVKPTIWFSVPSMLVYVLNMRALKESDLPTLRIVTFGGEGFPKNQLRKLWNHWGVRVRFVNVYGPTECTCICSSYDVTESDMANDELLPLGHMAPNFYGIVLNGNNEHIEEGNIGELYIGGPNVGIGYYNNLEKTNDVFINDPTIDTHKVIVYKSGDLVKQDPNTKLYLFCGRKDNQIKRMGYRIELEEIENAFNSIEFIKESAVVFIDNDKYQSKIIACLNSNKEDDNNISEILKKHLPSYMCPDLFIYYKELPKNQNGKIDRLKLKEELSK